MSRVVPIRLCAVPHGAVRGFTLIELVVVVTLFGILAALAGPSFQDMIIKQRMRTAAYDLMADLTFARSEAVKRNASVRVSKAGTWTGGWTIVDVTLDEDGNEVIGSTLRQHPAFSDTIAIAMGNASVDFLLNGRASATASFTIDDAGGKASIPARCISVDPSGRPRSTEGGC